MPDHQALAIVSCGLVLMALTLVRPSSGMRMVVIGVLLAAVALLAMNLGFKSLLMGMSGPVKHGLADIRGGCRVPERKRDLQVEQNSV
jgi:hypothetical protein